MTGCPYHDDRRLPADSTPLRPSPAFARWREEAAATPLDYPDGHRGLIVTRYDLARAVLEDARFTVTVPRMPALAGDATGVEPEEIDESATESLRSANLLSMDGEEHHRMRRVVLSQFSVRAVRARQDAVRAIVDDQLRRFLAMPQPADVFASYATPISTRTHCLVIGIPDSEVDSFTKLFVTGASGTQDKFDFIRRILDSTLPDGAGGVIGHLLSGGLTRAEIEGILFVLMTSGRDSVAYLITTALTALLTAPAQLERLRSLPERIEPAVEEFMRVGAMFVTLFPRTALEPVELDGVLIPEGTTVAVSPVAANHDRRRFEHPDDFDVLRDASGHLGFGHGPHGCVGQQLARLEIRLALTALIAAAPDLRLVRAEQLEPLPFAHPVGTYEAGALEVAWNR